MIICMDSQSQFFGLWSESYFFLGSSEWEAFHNLMNQAFISENKRVIASKMMEETQKKSLEKSLQKKAVRTQGQIENMLQKTGWYLGRDKQQEAKEQIQQTILDAKTQGFQIESFPSAEKFIRSYIDIKMDLWSSSKWSSYLSLGGIFGNDIEEMVVQSQMLRLSLFPIGIEVTCLDHSPYEVMLLFIDPQYRFYGIHWSGFYFLGSNEWEAFQNLKDQNFIEI
jgi:hypothetical protein